jgi:hypothetical protein
MKKNVGRTDQWVRVIVGAALLSMVFILSGGIRWIGLIGFIPLITGIFGYCPLYSLFGVSTRKTK